MRKLFPKSRRVRWAAFTAALVFGLMGLSEWSWAGAQAPPQKLGRAAESGAPRAMGRGDSPSVQSEDRGGGLLLGLLLVTAIGAGVLAYLYLKEKNKEEPDVSLTVAVQSDNKFDVIVDGTTVGTVPWAASITYAVMPSTGTHTVLLRAKEIEDTNVTIALKLNNSSKYKFAGGSITKGAWTLFNLGSDHVSGKFLFDRGMSLNTEFGFQVTIEDK